MTSRLGRFVRRLSGATPTVVTEDDAGPAVPAISAPVHIIADDALVGLADGRLELRRRDAPSETVPLHEVAQVSIHGEAGITSPCLRELMQRGIPVVFRSRTGYYAGQTADLSGISAAVRRAQYAAASDPARRLELARAFIASKIINARGVLRRRDGSDAVLRSLGRLAQDAASADRIERLLGIEGAAGAAYFPALARDALGPRAAWTGFDGRRQRPPVDPVNALLSYLYAVLVGECAAAALGNGLDPTVGFLHTERPGRPALALDLVEPLRPLIADAAALRLLNTGELTARHFGHEGDSPRLTDEGRRIVLAGLERRLAEAAPPGEVVRRDSYRGAIWRQAGRLAVALRDGGAVPPIERG